MRAHHFRPLNDMPNVDKIVLNLNWGPIVAAPIYIIYSTVPSLKFTVSVPKNIKIQRNFSWSSYSPVKLQVPARDIIIDQVPRDYPTVDGEVGKTKSQYKT